MKRWIAVLMLLVAGILDAQRLPPPRGIVDGQLPPPDHYINLAYYYADKPQWGDFRSQVDCYTDTYYLLVKQGAQVNPDDPQSFWFPGMQRQIAEAAGAGKYVHVSLDFPDPDFIAINGTDITLTPLFDQVLDALAPFWNNVVRVELADDVSWTKDQIDAVAQAVNDRLAAHGMDGKPLGTVNGANFLGPPIKASNLQWVGVDAYLCAPNQGCDGGTPGSEDSATNIAILNAMLTDAKERIAAANKDVVFIMQAYTQTPAWDNLLSNVVDMQTATYLQAVPDEGRVVAINMFAYGRGDGTAHHPELQAVHKDIARAMFGSISCDNPGSLAAPSNLNTTATNFKVALTWQDNSSTETGFNVQRMDNNSGVWNDIASVPANSTLYTDATAALGPTDSATYSYRVRARNDSTASDFSSAATITLYGALPDVPVLIGPHDCTTTLHPTFTWNATARASTYGIAATRVDIEDFFLNLPPGLVGTSYTLTSPTLLINVQYRWKLKACNNIGCSDYRQLLFTPFCGGVATTMTAPLGCVPTTVPTFTWAGVAFAVDYWLVVANSPDFSASTTTTYVDQHTTGTSLSPGVSFTPGQTYYAKVKTMVDTSTQFGGGWSATVSFIAGCQPPVARPGGPYVGGVGLPVPFNGSASTDPDGSVVAYNWTFGDGGIGTGAQPAHTYAAVGTYTVTLTVTDNSGNTASATTTATVTTLPPAITNLSATAQGFIVSLRWTDNSINETGFRIDRLDSVSNLWSQVGFIAANATAFTDSVPPLGSIYSITYTYRVSAVNPAGASPSTQTSIALYAAPPVVPTPIAPLNCIASLRPTLSWNAAARATSYHVGVTRVDIDSFFVNDRNIIGTSDTLTADLIGFVQYRWKVQACNNAGCGPWSPSMYFKPACSVVPNITSPLACTATQVPAFQWTATPGSPSYWLLVGNSADFSATTTVRYVDINTTATSYAPGVAFSPGVTYYAKVKSLGGTVGWSATISFTPLCNDTSPP